MINDFLTRCFYTSWRGEICRIVVALLMLTGPSSASALLSITSSSEPTFLVAIRVASTQMGAFLKTSPRTHLLSQAYIGLPDIDGWPLTAVYNIMGHVVVLPDGTRLEAHSGLGSRTDDPRFVHERMRGATPPALYDLVPLEQSFHGVAALRLKPISGGVFGRTDLLAHHYVIRGRPESHGCVVFSDHPAFLKAFRLGHVKRLRVVPAIGDTLLHLAKKNGRWPASSPGSITTIGDLASRDHADLTLRGGSVKL